MGALMLALASSACWGVSDFIGGVQTRRLPVVLVLIVVEGTGLLVLLAGVLLTGRAAPALGHLWPAALAGLGGVAALAAFYRALALGTMGIVAPVAALGVAVPVIVGIASGDHVGGPQVVGILLAVVGVVLVSREGGGPDPAGQVPGERLALGLALVASLGFGAFFVGLRASARWDVPWALIAARGPGVAVLLAVGLVAVLRRGPRARGVGPDERRAGQSARGAGPGARGVGLLIGSGLLDLGANGLYGLASRQGLLSIVSVASSLYPVITVLLARVVLEERVHGPQRWGVLAALSGIVMMAAG